jgi:RNA polymerase sigma factor (sigma-70 family)
MSLHLETENAVNHGKWFATTQWNVVLTAKEDETSEASAALDQLCRTYWPPLYAYICRDGYNVSEAQDLTQEFFFRLIDRNYLQHLRHQRGRFRSFLLTFLKHFLSEQRGKARTQKRGGGVEIISFEQSRADGSYFQEPVDLLSPDQVFERRWAQTLFQTALNRLREEYAASGKGALFEVLTDFQPREAGAPSYVEIGAQFGMSETAIKSTALRMRQRHRDILREEIARTVTSVDEIEEEIQHVREVLARPAC